MGIPTWEGCGAKKMVQYDKTTNIATVYHLGFHSCRHLQINQRATQEYWTHTMASNFTSGPAKAIGIHKISRLIDEGDMTRASQTAECWVDKRFVKQVMEKINPNTSDDQNSFDAVGIVKQKCGQ